MKLWSDRILSRTLQISLKTCLNCMPSGFSCNQYLSRRISRRVFRMTQLFSPRRTNPSEKFWKTWRTAERHECQSYVQQRSLLDKINESNVWLEEVEKGLNDYIEKEKTLFPRFYFLSNETLLKILSETKDLQRVKENLKTYLKTFTMWNSGTKSS